MKMPSIFARRELLADLDEQPRRQLLEGTGLDGEADQVGARLGQDLALAPLGPWLGEMADGQRRQRHGQRQQQDRFGLHPKRSASGLDDRQLGIGVHAVQRLARPDVKRERQHEVDHRRNERCSKRKEREQRLARRRQEVDVEQDLRDEHHQRRRRQGDQGQRERAAEDVSFEQVHRAIKKRLGNARDAPVSNAPPIIAIPAAAWNAGTANIAETNVVNTRIKFI